jgi:hypothetical protein
MDKRKSPIWQYFIYDESCNKSNCMLPDCGKWINGKNPTNLQQHIDNNHKEESKLLSEKLQDWRNTKKKIKDASKCATVKIDSVFAVKNYSLDSYKQINITKKLAVFIATSTVANRLVENEEFRDLLNELDPRYVVPGRQKIKSEMEKVLCVMKENVKCLLKQARRVHLCCDIWTKKGMTESFLGVTAHFFAQDACHKVALAVRSIDSPHTGDVIVEVVKCVLKEWDIPAGKVGKVLTDNGSNMLKAFKTTIEDQDEELPDDNALEENVEEMYVDSDGLDVDIEIEPDETEVTVTQVTEMQEATEDIADFDEREEEHRYAFASNDYQRLSCFSHTLQLVVIKFDEVKPFKEAISKAKKLVAHFNKSVKATKMLIELAGKKMIGDCPTRWNSTYLLLERLMETRQHVETVLNQLNWEVLQPRHWKAVENTVQLLKPFAEYTGLIGGEDYSTISCIVPVLMELKLHLAQVNLLYLNGETS